MTADEPPGHGLDLGVDLGERPGHDRVKPLSDSAAPVAAPIEGVCGLLWAFAGEG